MMKAIQRITRVVAAMACATIMTAQTEEASDLYSPMVGNHYPMQVYWGDTHMHTAYSYDATLMGTSLTPVDAFRFARGESVRTNNGMLAKINRPLDFLTISDHAEYLGSMLLIRKGSPAMMAQPDIQKWRDLIKNGDMKNIPQILLSLGNSYGTGKPILKVPTGVDSPWREEARMADAANTPGVFTTFIAFEWNSQPDGNNLHRVVMFRDDATFTDQVEPFSAIDSNDPTDLWHYLAQYEHKTGGQVLAIPHNGNLSGGLMFTESNFAREPMTRQDAATRARWERLVEITQIKGDSETHPLLSPNDEFADFATWDKSNLGMNHKQSPDMFQHEYVRSALKIGLELGAGLGVNPYHFGFVGGTDDHTGMPAVEEDNYFGQIGTDEPSAGRAGRDMIKNEVVTIHNWEAQAAGYTGVWATANTRAAIFDAMKRREVYASTGPRITVRFFGGWDYHKNDINRPRPALIGYERGVPMGDNLPKPPSDATAPTFMLWALKDTQGANLDRLQIIKGWLSADGKTHEKVYDVAWSGDRKPGQDGKLSPVGNTVDIEHASYTNSIGTPELATVWTDPHFDPEQRAFYYLRVLEIPTPRWVVYDHVRLGAELPKDAKLIHQERAYTSPIWYTPAN